MLKILQSGESQGAAQACPAHRGGSRTFVASLYPVPTYPQNLMIYIFAALIISGMGWFLVLRIRRPGTVSEIEIHLDNNYDRFAIERAAQSDAAF
jgi:hypothetical protein